MERGDKMETKNVDLQLLNVDPCTLMYFQQFKKVKKWHFENRQIKIIAFIWVTSCCTMMKKVGQMKLKSETGLKLLKTHQCAADSV